MRVQPIESINRDAQRNQFRLEDLPWAQGVDRQKFWCPELLTHLYYCPSYKQLTDDEKRTYNQFFAMGVCEQFILLEELLLVHGMRRIIDHGGDRLTDELRQALFTIIEEEKKHTAMFRRLLEASAPDLYAASEFVVYRLSRTDRGMIEFFLRHTDLFICWVWIAMVFEEKSLDFYRKYTICPQHENLDGLYRAAHRAHAIEEARHVQIDHYLVDVFWHQAAGWKKRLNDWVFYAVMRGFAHPRRTVNRMIDLLVERCPRLESMAPQLKSEALAVASTNTWQDASYSRQSLPWTFRLMDSCPEMRLLPTLFPRYRPGEGDPDEPRTAAP